MVDTSGWDAHQYLQAVYQGLIVAEHTRMKAAIECLPFEKPKLALNANVTHKGMGDAMDAARAGTTAKQIEGRVLTQSAAPMAPQAQAVAALEHAVAAGTPQRPVVSEATLKRVADRMIPGREGDIGPMPRRKPG
jgi:hypothetical protein